MSIQDVVKSLLAEVKGPDRDSARKQQSVDTEDAGRAAGRTPKPNEPDPEEVQYPGYFKDGGSL